MAASGDWRFLRLATVIAASTLASACMDRELIHVPPGLQSGVSVEIQQSESDVIDLLVLSDRSPTMVEEQANLAANFQPLISALISPPDDDGDGEPDWSPVSDLHIGVISQDMGTGGYPVATCDNPERGDDGVLLNLPSPDVPGCAVTYPKFLTFVAEEDDPAQVALDFECIATQGINGCGFEQQLAAIEKALTVHAAPGAANDGFLRDDALLAILVVTDENDCSVGDPSMFSDDPSLGPLNVRCGLNPDLKRPVEDFVDAMLSIKPGRPDRVVVAAITGVPPDLVELSEEDLITNDVMTTTDFEDILDDPRMVEAVDHSPQGGGNQLVPSCNVPGVGLAFPPRRIVEWIRDIDRVGNNGLVQSICQSDFSDAMRAITRLIGSKVRGACLPRPLVGPNGVPLPTGEHADCMIRETLRDGSACLAGRIEIDETRDGRTVCQVCQQGDGEDPYLVDLVGTDLRECSGTDAFWFYTTQDENCAGAGKVEFTPGDEPPDGATIRLECLSEVGAR